MYYSMGFHVSNYRAMHRPEASINSEGVVPTERTGKRNKEMSVA